MSPGELLYYHLQLHDSYIFTALVHILVLGSRKYPFRHPLNCSLFLQMLTTFYSLTGSSLLYHSRFHLQTPHSHRRSTPVYLRMFRLLSTTLPQNLFSTTPSHHLQTCFPLGFLSWPCTTTRTNPLLKHTTQLPVTDASSAHHRPPRIHPTISFLRSRSREPLSMLFSRTFSPADPLAASLRANSRRTSISTTSSSLPCASSTVSPPKPLVRNLLSCEASQRSSHSFPAAF